MSYCVTKEMCHYNEVEWEAFNEHVYAAASEEDVEDEAASIGATVQDPPEDRLEPERVSPASND